MVSKHLGISWNGWVNKEDTFFFFWKRLFALSMYCFWKELQYAVIDVN